MNERIIFVTPSAYSYPLLIKQLLHTPLAQAAAPGDRLPRPEAPDLRRTARPDRQTGERSRKDRRTPRRDGRSSRLGQQPIS